MPGVPPIILTIQVCDSVVLDQRTGRASVLNIFETINAPEYPATHHSMTFFSELTNGHGKVDINVKLVDVQEDDKTIAEVKSEVVFVNVTQICRCILTFGGVTFPEKGEYRFQLFLNRELAGERRLVCNVIAPGR